jgi:hypothetical protein
MRASIITILLLVVAVGNSSCSLQQWRDADRAIDNRFPDLSPALHRGAVAANRALHVNSYGDDHLCGQCLPCRCEWCQ